ncbi:peptidase inhibitor family I36 protein [Streptomyces fuscigenes]|uniref:peptidase inhibitor family I36 protein n=1 Tax=Streptomyces fuscigenes TaxID=1528880 RepID=UPI001F1B2E39|nr:peptidase inhibitor family I36 protein [Streptomyces fuscigenes]MCF3964198.1 peptidase inhibitor family I36 protein [Streptomyces fuscigenes]
MRRVTTTAAALLAAVLPFAAAAPAGAAPAPLRGGECAAGELCLWAQEDFGGGRSTYELTGAGIEDCVALPAGRSALSLANRLGRPVTAYQSAECAETGEFETYPGHGTWVPRAPYRVRAFKIWEH